MTQSSVGQTSALHPSVGGQRAAHHKGFPTHALSAPGLSAPWRLAITAWAARCRRSAPHTRRWPSRARPSRPDQRWLRGAATTMTPARPRAAMESATNMGFPFSSWLEQILQKQSVCWVLLGAAVRLATIGACLHSGGNGKSRQAGIASGPAVNGRQEKGPDPRASADWAGDRSCCSSRKPPDGPVGVIACKA